MNDVTAVVSNFQKFLCAGYETWRESLSKAPDLDWRSRDQCFSDWAQANWELLVERSICPVGESLEVYSGGSDYEEAAHSRVFFHAKLPTHVVCCRPRSAEKIIDLLSGQPFDLGLSRFSDLVAFRNRYYLKEPPFDHLLLDLHGAERCIEVALVQFVKVSLSDLSEHG